MLTRVATPLSMAPVNCKNASLELKLSPTRSHQWALAKLIRVSNLAITLHSWVVAAEEIVQIHLRQPAIVAPLANMEPSSRLKSLRYKILIQSKSNPNHPHRLVLRKTWTALTWAKVWCPRRQTIKTRRSSHLLWIRKRQSKKLRGQTNIPIWSSKMASRWKQNK